MDKLSNKEKRLEKNLGGLCINMNEKRLIRQKDFNNDEQEVKNVKDINCRAKKQQQKVLN